MVSDPHLLLSYLRPTLAHPIGPDGRPAILAEYHRPLSAYLAAALPLGFQVRHCEEPSGPPRVGAHAAAGPLPTHVSWELMGWCPDAAAAAMDDSPIVVVWHFQLDTERD